MKDEKKLDLKHVDFEKLEKELEIPEVIVKGKIDHIADVTRDEIKNNPNKNKVLVPPGGTHQRNYPFTRNNVIFIDNTKERILKFLDIYFDHILIKSRNQRHAQELLTYYGCLIDNVYIRGNRALIYDISYSVIDFDMKQTVLEEGEADFYNLKTRINRILELYGC